MCLMIFHHEFFDNLGITEHPKRYFECKKTEIMIVDMNENHSNKRIQSIVRDDINITLITSCDSLIEMLNRSHEDCISNSTIIVSSLCDDLDIHYDFTLMDILIVLYRS